MRTRAKPPLGLASRRDEPSHASANTVRVARCELRDSLDGAKPSWSTVGAGWVLLAAAGDELNDLLARLFG